MAPSQQDFKAIVLGDLHVEEKSLKECQDIITEVCSLRIASNINTIIQVGDLCDKNRLNATELLELTHMMHQLKSNFEYVYILEGNHDKQDRNTSIIQYLKYLGIHVVDDYFVWNNFLFGHWFTDKSTGAFGHYRYTVDELKEKNYKGVILGHQHDPQVIDENIHHIGSARYTSFGENHKLLKKVGFISNDNLTFAALSSPIPLCKVSSIEELKSLPDRAKVQYEFKSFTQLKEEIKTINELKNRFFSFKKKNDFVMDIKRNSVSSSPKRDIRDIIQDFLGTIKEAEIKNILEEEFKGELI